MRKKYGGRQKGTPNKLTTEVKEKLHQVLEECITTINPSEMTKQEKLKAIQICLQYLVPKPKEEFNAESEFPQKIEIEIIDGNKKEKL